MRSAEEREAVDLNLSYGRANRHVGQLIELGILDAVDPNAYNRPSTRPAFSPSRKCAPGEPTGPARFSRLTHGFDELTLAHSGSHSA